MVKGVEREAQLLVDLRQTRMANGKEFGRVFGELVLDGIAQFEFVELCQVFPFGTSRVDLCECFDGWRMGRICIDSFSQNVECGVFVFDFVAHDARNCIELFSFLLRRSEAFEASHDDAQHIFDAVAVAQ